MAWRRTGCTRRNWQKSRNRHTGSDGKKSVVRAGPRTGPAQRHLGGGFAGSANIDLELPEASPALAEALAMPRASTAPAAIAAPVGDTGTLARAQTSTRRSFGAPRKSARAGDSTSGVLRGPETSNSTFFGSGALVPVQQLSTSASCMAAARAIARPVLAS